ncbi:hypothetical protein DLAC_10735 [Tieghemostelium lacteum]|uniref:Uncharacterized protein n=1 Tax=Tieghemostelium lacteum TaxID=361077 RepID=A0A151Z416_TIELA|nr:hypothetical protein DLAC_10735 [Tieghemostelium lacteum]|eukprot:KYQ88713.1 hypothetical protein DLAC_10735 [Tieghemostelium lacteum]
MTNVYRLVCKSWYSALSKKYIEFVIKSDKDVERLKYRPSSRKLLISVTCHSRLVGYMGDNSYQILWDCLQSGEGILHAIYAHYDNAFECNSIVEKLMKLPNVEDTLQIFHFTDNALLLVKNEPKFNVTLPRNIGRLSIELELQDINTLTCLGQTLKYLRVKSLVDPQWKLIFRHLHHLETLYFTMVENSNQQLSSLLEIIESSCKSLIELNLSSVVGYPSWTNELNLMPLVDFINSNKSLTSLKLLGNDIYQCSSVNNLTIQNSTLKTFYMHTDQYSFGQTIETIYQLWSSGFSNLNEITVKDYRDFPNLLLIHSNCTSLEIQGNYQDVDMKSILSKGKIKKLKLGNNFNGKTLDSLLPTIYIESMATHLTYLNITKINFNNLLILFENSKQLEFFQTQALIDRESDTKFNIITLSNVIIDSQCPLVTLKILSVYIGTKRELPNEFFTGITNLIEKKQTLNNLYFSYLASETLDQATILHFKETIEKHSYRLFKISFANHGQDSNNKLIDILNIIKNKLY